MTRRAERAKNKVWKLRERAVLMKERKISYYFWQDFLCKVMKTFCG